MFENNREERRPCLWLLRFLLIQGEQYRREVKSPAQTWSVCHPCVVGAALHWVPGFVTSCVIQGKLRSLFRLQFPLLNEYGNYCPLWFTGWDPMGNTKISRRKESPTPSTSQKLDKGGAATIPQQAHESHESSEIYF